MHNQAFETPIVFIIFNRPDLTDIVFKKIAQVQPKYLTVIADGPRDTVAGDSLNCQKARAIIEGIDWDCELIKDYSDKNIGCKLKVATGLTKAFSIYEQAIILEDDCIPDHSFFYYCESLLNKYQDDDSVMHIGGSQFLSNINLREDYYFSSVPQIWGWASWRRAWQYYDLEMKDWPQHKATLMNRLSFVKGTIKHLTSCLESTYQGSLDSWDYQWVYTVLKHQGKCITPCQNLIQNRGFDHRATHTQSKNHAYGEMLLNRVEFPLVHPEDGRVLSELEAQFIQKRYYKNTLIEKTIASIKKRLPI